MLPKTSRAACRSARLNPGPDLTRLRCSRFVVLPTGYYMGTVEAVKAMLAVQHRAAGTQMQPAQYGELCRAQPEARRSRLAWVT